ncbi:MAG: hypothetical protein NUW23_01575 [Firmicutes bacterium]|jgi:hypothetical protein|nr:hypothetical protein [Bacillota bacterium]
MQRITVLATLFLLLLFPAALRGGAQAPVVPRSDVEEDGLRGLVHSVVSMVSSVSWESGTPVETGQILLSVWGYDPYGRMKDRSEYGPPKGTLSGHTVYNHDPEGNLVEKITYSMGNMVLTRTAISRDASGRVLEERVYDAEGKLQSWTTRAYRADGKIDYELVFNADGALVSRVAKTYGEVGHVSEESVYGPDGSQLMKRVYQYELDAFENWTRRTMTEWQGSAASGNPARVEVVDRVITYSGWT